MLAESGQKCLHLRIGKDGSRNASLPRHETSLHFDRLIGWVRQLLDTCGSQCRFPHATMSRTHPVTHLEAILVIGIGGFAGANVRYFFDLALPTELLPTLVANVVGCAALGFFLYERRNSGIFSDRSQLVLATGFISSFTTYSTFVVDTIETAPLVAIVYVFGTYLLGFAAVLLGRAGARRIRDTGAVEGEPSGAEGG